MRAGRRRPAVVFHDAEHLAAALAAATAAGQPIVALTPAGGHAYGGARIYWDMVQAARSRYPEAEACPMFDAGDDGAVAFGAIRMGWPAVVFTGKPAVLGKLRQIAAAHHVEVLQRRPRALDLIETAQPEEAVRALLASPGGGRVANPPGGALLRPRGS